MEPPTVLQNQSEVTVWRGAGHLDVDTFSWDLPIKILPTNPALASYMSHFTGSNSINIWLFWVFRHILVFLEEKSEQGCAFQEQRTFFVAFILLSAPVLISSFSKSTVCFVFEFLSSFNLTCVLILQRFVNSFLECKYLCIYFISTPSWPFYHFFLTAFLSAWANTVL